MTVEVWAYLGPTRVRSMTQARTDDSVQQYGILSFIASPVWKFMTDILKEPRKYLRRRSLHPLHRSMVQQVEKEYSVAVVSSVLHSASDSLFMGTVNGELYCAPNGGAERRPIRVAGGLGCCDGLWELSGCGVVRTFCSAEGRCHDLEPVEVIAA
ncbi:hypothetical protein FOL47_009202 [Perkinsus chesapeaki]|uniref:Uncharacterized protein n=1 Tax=Perkinsus chesapeaki TaxID=330153 RepID=A0A7J6LA17_PERCH|nr:hypothetical protein FOL47_009202 [Perkinsus chesapeaki]